MEKKQRRIVEKTLTPSCELKDRWSEAAWSQSKVAK